MCMMRIDLDGGSPPSSARSPGHRSARAAGLPTGAKEIGRQAALVV
jgi:hypothetical protein